MPAGRPTVMTESVIRKLEDAFMLGCTDLEACFAADISKTTLYKYCEANPEFAERKEALKSNPVYLAKSVVVDALKDGDRQVALDTLKRKEGSKVAVTGNDGGPLEITRVVRKVVNP